MRQFCAYIKYNRRIIVFGLCILTLIAYFSRHLFALSPDKKQVSNVNLHHIAEQLAQTELRIKEKEITFSRLYSVVLYTRGRFTCKTIVVGNLSRLSLADSTLKPSRSARDPLPLAERAYVRYNDSDFDITMPSAVTAYELDIAFQGTPLYGLGKDFISAELDTGINAIFLAAVAAHESSWGASLLSREHNNLFGFGAYDSDPGMANNFASKGESIAFVAKFLRDHYIEGSYYRGHSIKDINTLYSSDQGWSKGIFLTMMKIDNSIQQHFSN